MWQTAQSYRPWCRNLPRIYSAVTTAAADRKRILRFVVREVVLDQRRAQGQVWLKIVWQTGATSEHCLQRRVHTYRDSYRFLNGCGGVITELNNAGKMDKEIAASLKPRRASSPPAAVPSRAKMFGYCVPAGRRSSTTKINGASPNPDALA